MATQRQPHVISRYPYGTPPTRVIAVHVFLAHDGIFVKLRGARSTP